VEERLKSLIALIIAALSVPWASILVVFSGAPGVVCAFWRLIFSLLITLILLLLFGDGFKVNFKILLLTFISGFCLSIHFAFWMESLHMIPIAISTTIVDSYPLFSVILGWLFLGERFVPIQLFGGFIGFLGVVGLSFSTFKVEESFSSLGVLYALIGAVSISLYFIIGRFLRRFINTLLYTVLVYSWACIPLFAYLMFFNINFLYYNVNSWIFFIALAVVPMLLGHSMLNYALKFFSLLAVTMVTLAEPVGSAILAYILLHQRFGIATSLYMALTLTGILLTLIGERDW